VATKTGVELVSFDDQPGELLLERLALETKELNRFNDGKVDPTGRHAAP
jgi:sugar lactone lactonase YvrE